MSNFYEELKRRHVVRVGIAYVIGGGLMIELIDTIAPRLGMPDWVPTFIIIVILIGLPIALLFSWSYEMTPQGLKKTHEVDADDSLTPSTGRKLDFVIIGALVLALGYFVWERQQILVAPQPETAEGTPAFKAIAVLPFVNLSNDPEQEYFSDGISEELLNVLAKVKGLRVTSRTSAFAFKGKDTPIPDIAAALGVQYVLEGSVRRDAGQVRITAQLIDVETDSHLWSETYDREFSNIFVVQDEIAAKVVEQLKVTLLGAAPTVQTADPEAYALVLQARYLGRQRTPDALEKSIALLEQALAIDPDYAAAWAGLADGYINQAYRGLRPYDEGFRLAREAANQALALDPAYAPAYDSLANIAMLYDHNMVSAARHYERALAIEPANADIVSGAARLAAYIGRLDQAVALAEYAAARDPMNPLANARLGLIYIYAGRLDEAIASWRTTLTLSPGFSGAQYGIGTELLEKGEPQAALAAMQKEAIEAYRLLGLVTAHHALGQAAASEAALAELIEKYEKEWAFNIAYVLAFRGEADRAFEWLNKAVAYKNPGLVASAIFPLFANIHADPRWLPFLESIGKSPEQLAAIEFKVTLPE
ncbi:MAG: hypothetical protein IH996_10210 [Proteobacteria bacterium]|nr:hypothetical protein [Pseudomonadota bacterium]